MAKNILVLNMGMKSIRSIIFNDLGEKLASASRPLETQLSEDYVTQDTDEWWQKARAVVGDCMSQVPHVRLDYITVTSSAACLAYVDEDGRPLGPCIMVSDKRAKAESIFLSGLESFKELSVRTGLPADPYYMIPKALWLKRRQPETYSKIRKLLAPNDYLIFKMTGKFVTDSVNAQKWYFDAGKKTYPLAVLNEAGIDAKLLPPVVSPGSFVGFLTEGCARELGLPTSVKVIATTYDAICSFVGSGASREGEASDVSGTVTVFRVVAKKPASRKGSKIQFIPFNENSLKLSDEWGGVYRRRLEQPWRRAC